jgi:hypothetical protein
MRLKALVAAVLFALPLALTSSDARAGGYGRQYYSSWHYHPTYHYSYRYYYYKPYDDYYGYKHHYVFYYPSYPNYYYYYNPYKKYYWGRCPSHLDGEAHYSLLPEDARKPDLESIPESAFPKPGPMPPIPESKMGDSATVDLPPDDLPPVPNQKDLKDLPTAPNAAK